MPGVVSTVDNSKVIIKSGNINAWIFDGSLSQSNGATVIEGNSSVEISGGTISGQVFGALMGGTPILQPFKLPLKAIQASNLQEELSPVMCLAARVQIATSIEAALMPTFTAIRLLKSSIMHLWTETYLADP